MSNQKVVRVGSRKSELAIIQTKSVIARLQNAFPEQNFEIQTMTTMGDRVLNISLPKIGEKSLFTRDLEDALLCGGVDFVVHSLKDLPTALPEGMVIGAVLERDDERDALVLRKDYSNYKIETLPEGSVIGTSSLRRAAQLRKLYPHLIINDIRGNLNTRLAKLDAADSRFTGIILAKAGLERMNWTTRISQVLDPGTVLYAVGQGALAVECRKNDHKILGMIKTLSCLTTTCRVLVERSFLKTLGGGCSAPVAVFSRLYESNNTRESGLHIVGGVWSLDGSKEIKEEKKYSLQIIQTKQNIPALMQRKRKADFKEKTGDDILVDDFSKTFEQDTLLKKHIGLVSKCPYINTDKTDKMLNHAIGRGGGDADVLDNRCPLNFGVGQDFMGQCPFIKMNETLSSADTKSSEDSPSTSTNLAFERESIDQTNNKSVHQPSPNCPFLKKNVEIFDYKKENDEALTSALLSSTIKEHCGIYKHDFLTDDLFDKCNNFGIQLAEELIKHGALDIMHTAQAEIHKVI